MKSKNFVYPLLFGAGAVAGFFIKGWPGGYLAGSCSMLLIFVTLGRRMAKKAQQRIDAAILLKSKM